MTDPARPELLGSQLFGTDGVRAPFGAPPLDRSTVTALGYHLGRQLQEGGGPASGGSGGDGPPEPLVILGGDTRDSTPTLQAWLTQGLAAAGARAVSAGVVPTPAVAYLARSTGAAAGIAISASHNPHPDNGLKLIGPGGFKWPEGAEEELEGRLAREPQPADLDLEAEPPSPELDPELDRRYLDSLRESLRGRRGDGGSGEAPLEGLSVVLDPGHGAASPWAGGLFEELGARVQVLHADPDGTNINRGCGSTHPEVVAAAVRERGAHLGVAFDGDADRAIFADEHGAVRDGDAVLYLWARDLAQHGRLQPKAIVATSMSNLGLARALERHGIELVRCAVGDRAVVETLKERGLQLGGEQSGHIVHLGLTTTGDGLLTALQVSARVARAPGRSLAGLLEGFRRYPQVLVNVKVSDKPPFGELPAVLEVARSVEERLGDDGRLVLRYSGTEPLARVMIEGPDQGRIEVLAGELADVIRRAVGA